MSKYSESRLSKRLGLLLFACMFVVGLGYAQNASAFVRVSAGVTYRSGGYDLLSEYGEWMRVSPYGVVWCPYVDESWEPFYDGRWIRTRRGWAWDSYEPFGDIVYHYGYWYNEPEIGWFWVPGNEWSPARVQWYTYGDYCGWAPLPPPHFYWPDPWDSHGFNVWVVVNIGDFYNDHVGRHGINRHGYRDIFQRKGGFKHAPDFQRIETATRREIPVRTIAERPMDIRTDRIKIAERSATRRDTRTREIAASRQRTQTQREVGVSNRSAGVEREAEATASRRTARVERKAEVTTPSQNARGERKTEATASKRTARGERKTEATASRRTARGERKTEATASGRTTRGERKTEAPAKSARSTKSRAAEKRAERDTDRRAKR